MAASRETLAPVAPRPGGWPWADLDQHQARLPRPGLPECPSTAPGAFLALARASNLTWVIVGLRMGKIEEEAAVFNVHAFARTKTPLGPLPARRLSGPRSSRVLTSSAQSNNLRLWPSPSKRKGTRQAKFNQLRRLHVALPV